MEASDEHQDVEEAAEVNPQDVTESVRVVCGGCRREYTFDIRGDVLKFTTICPHGECGTSNTWVRQ